MEGQCEICSSSNAIYHFGAISCRACGAFFRRLVVSGRRYDCDCEEKLKGSAKESAEAKQRRIMNCRGCRLRRCRRAGMKEEAVRSATFHAFHQERKKCVQLAKMQTNLIAADEVVEGDDFTKLLLDIEAKASRIYLNVVGFGADHLAQFSSFEQLLLHKDNLLAHSDSFTPSSSPHFNGVQFENHIQKCGLWNHEPRPFIKHLLIFINVAKILPAFGRLDLNDQIASVSGFVLAACHLFGRFHSIQRKAKTAVLEDGYPLVRLYTQWTNIKDPVIENLAQAIFHGPMEDFVRISPNRAEFAHLIALLYTNAATSSLSQHAQQIMNEETEKCSSILLRLQQSWFGQQAGALRYAESLQLLWNAIGAARRHRELIVYIDSFYEQGRFEAVMPKILAPLVIDRQKKCD